MTPSHTACQITDPSPGEEQPRQSSPLLAVCDEHRYQPRWFCFRPHKPHEDDRDLFTVVLTQYFCSCIYCLESITLCRCCRFHFHVYYHREQRYNTSINVRKDMIRVIHLLSGELTVTTFDNALSLSEGVDLCLTLQHHLMILFKSHTQGKTGERHTSSAML